MKLYRFELLFFDGTVITGKFCVGVPLNIQSIYLSIAENTGYSKKVKCIGLYLLAFLNPCPTKSLLLNFSNHFSVATRMAVSSI